MKKSLTFCLTASLLFLGTGISLINGSPTEQEKAVLAETTIVSDTLTFNIFTKDSTSSSFEYTSNTTFTSYQGYMTSYSAGATKLIGLRNGASGGVQSEPSGIVTTKSFGRVRKITVVSSYISDSSALDVYGKKSESYESSGDLYVDKTMGEKIFTFNKTNGKEYTFSPSDDYQYIGFKTEATVLRINSITIEWEPLKSKPVIPEEELHISPDGLPHETGIQILGDFPVEFESDDESVFTVDENGLVTGVGVGEANLYVWYGEGDNDYEIYHIVVTQDEDVAEIRMPLSNETLSEPAGWELVTDPATLKDGDVITFASYSDGNYYVSSGWDTEWSNCIAVTSSSTLDDALSGATMISVLEVDGQFILYIEDEENAAFLGGFWSYDSTTGTWAFDMARSSSYHFWDISLDDNYLATISNAEDENSIIAYGDGDFWLGGDVLPQIYRYTGEYERGIVVTDKVNGESPALNFAQKFLKLAENATTDEEIIAALNAAKATSQFTSLEDTSYMMFKYAEANSEGDSIQKAMALYDYIVGKCELEDFFDRSPVYTPDVIIPGEPANIALDGQYHSTGIEVADGVEPTFTSSNPNVFVVDEDGNVKATGGGVAELLITVNGQTYRQRIVVEEEINPITVPGNSTSTSQSGWVRVEDVSELKDGDVVTFVSQRENGDYYAAGDWDSYYTNCLGESAATVDEQTDYLSATDAAQLIIFENDGTYSFYVDTNTFDGWLGGHYDEELDFLSDRTMENPEWTISIDEQTGYATVKNTEFKGKQILYDEEDFYLTSGWNPIYLYKFVGQTSACATIDDTVDGNSAALQFSHYFLNKMAEVCDADGQTGKANILKVIDEIMASDEYAAVEASTISKLMLEYATASETGDTIQKAVALYDYIAGKYEISNLFNREIPTNAANPHHTTFANETAILSIVMVLGTFVTFAFALKARKKKENI